MEIKDILKEKRLEKKLTLDDVARMVGVSGATISRWESGDIANMKRDKIVKLANALSVSPSVIMGWDEPVDYEIIDKNKTEQLNRIKKYCELLSGLNDKGKKYVFKQIDFALSQDDLKKK